ncbi:MAG: aminotransferase class V-fold PLP-dependent enzyme [Gaiellales bacterium]|jgi:cysteine desulfurase / selenocysteine lyase
MAVALNRTPLDAERIRADFPILNKPQDGRRLVYLDSASSAQKPRQVIERLAEVYENGYANVHRGVYRLGSMATESYEASRDTIAAFLNVGDRREVIFTRDTTEGLNLVAYAYGRSVVQPGDAIVSTEMEHHSNLVPWQFLAQQTGATLHYLRLTEEGTLDPESLARLDDVENVRIVAVGHVSNSLGTVNDVKALAAWAHARGAVLVVDGAQAAPHRAIDVQDLGADFYAISGHKMCGPGAGALWGRAELLERMPPFLTGGEMIRKVELERTSWNDLPWKFEAGTPAIAECIAFGTAVEYLQAIGMDAIEAHEHELVAYGYDLLAGIDGVTQYGPRPPARAGILSFNVDGVHPHDVAQVLDSEAICVRAGHHCTQPLMRAFDLVATTRASVYLYNTRDDLDRLVEGIDKVKHTFG